MPSSSPICAINEWSCVLACVEWLFKSQGTQLTQADIISRFTQWYPEWINRKGVMGTGDIITLFARLGIPVRKFIHLNDKEGVLYIINRYYNQQDYLGGFVLTNIPTHHCLAIESWDGDKVNVMEPDQKRAYYSVYTWDDLFQNRDADVLLLFR